MAYVQNRNVLRLPRPTEESREGGGVPIRNAPLGVRAEKGRPLILARSPDAVGLGTAEAASGDRRASRASDSGRARALRELEAGGVAPAEAGG